MNLSIHTMRSIGARIRRLRKKKRLTQETLAELSGYSTGYIGSIENARKVPSMIFLFDVARALDTTPTEILIDSGKEIDREHIKKQIRKLLERL